MGTYAVCMGLAGVRFRVVLLALIALLVLSGAVVLVVDRRVMLRIEPARVTVRLPVGRHEQVAFRLVNAHPWRDATIDFVKAQCGCFRIVQEPDRVPAGTFREILMDIFIDPRGDRVNNELRVYLPSGRKVTAEVNADPIPPFDGWPQWARFDREDGVVRIGLDSRYGDMISDARVFAGDGTPVETMLTPDAVVAVDPGAEGTLRVVFATDEGEIVWEGDLYQPPSAQPSP